MKKVLFIALAAVVALASCAREELAGPETVSNGRKVLKTFTVTLPEATVRTSLDGTKVSWELGDTIFFHDGTTMQKIGVPAAGPSFEFKAEVAEGATNFVALYSKTEAAPGFQVDTITLKTSLAQYRNKNYSLGDADVLAAKSSDGNLTFYHAFGILAFNVNKAATRLMIRTPNHEAIGNGKDGAFPRITVKAAEAPVFRSNCFTDALMLDLTDFSGTAYVAVPPCILAAGTEFWMEDTEGNIYCRKTTQDNEAEAGLVLRMGDASAIMAEENKVNARFEKVVAMPTAEDLTSSAFLMCASADDKVYEFTGCESGVGQNREITKDVTGTNVKLTLDNLFHALRFAASEESTYNINIQGMYLTLNSNANNLNKANPLPSGDKVNRGRWTVAYDAEKSVVITNKQFNTRYIRWNNTSPRFCCYTTVQTNVDLYKYCTVELGAKELDLSSTTVDAPGNAGDSFVELVLSNIDESDVQVSSDNAEITAAVEDGKVKITCTENAGKARNATITVSCKSDPGVAAKEIAVIQRAYLEGIGELNGALDGTRTKYTVKLENAVVSYALDSTKCFIQDATGGIYVYQYTSFKKEFVAGNKFTGYLNCDAYDYGLNSSDKKMGTKEIVALDLSNVEVTAGEAPAATIVTIAQLNDNFSAYEGRMVVLEGVTVSDGVTLAADRAGTLSKDAATFAFYSQNTKLSVETGAVLNFTGFPTYNKENKQICLYDAAHLDFISRVTNLAFAAEKTMGVNDVWELDAVTNSTGDVSYVSSDPTVVSIADGKATALKAGSATITATVAADGLFPTKSAECAVTVSDGPVAKLQYTLDGTITGGTAAYDGAGDITQSDIAWKVQGNTTQNPWRIGGKNLTNADRTVYSATAIPANINRIEIAHGTASSITVNSVTVTVHSTAAAAADGSAPIATFTPAFAANNIMTVEKEGETSWAGCFYRIVYNVSVSGSTNRYVQLSNIKFYGFDVE